MNTKLFSFKMLIFLVTLTLGMIMVEPTSSNMQDPNNYSTHARRLGKCDGDVGDCAHTDDEEIDHVVFDNSRRILPQSGYISYGALQRDNVPCNVRGNSYYNCNSHQRTNPYSRGCTQITHCARNNHWRYIHVDSIRFLFFKFDCGFIYTWLVYMYLILSQH